MSEDVRKAKETVPHAMVLTIIINSMLAFIMALVIVCYMVDPAEALEPGYPIIPILRHTLRDCGKDGIHRLHYMGMGS
jgi:amino acid transporter